MESPDEPFPTSEHVTSVDAERVNIAGANDDDDPSLDHVEEESDVLQSRVEEAAEVQEDANVRGAVRTEPDATDEEKSLIADVRFRVAFLREEVQRAREQGAILEQRLVRYEILYERATTEIIR